MSNQLVSFLVIAIPLLFSQISSAEQTAPVTTVGPFVATGNGDESLELAYYLHCHADIQAVRAVSIELTATPWRLGIEPVRKQITLAPGEGGTLLVPLDKLGSTESTESSVQFNYTLAISGAALKGNAIYWTDGSDQKCKLLEAGRLLATDTGETHMNIRPLHDRVIVKRMEE